MRRGRVVAGVLAVAAAASAGGVAVVHDHGVSHAAAANASTGSTGDSKDTSLAKVVKKDLTRTETLNGTVGHGAQTPLKLGGSGTITHLPAVNDVISFGQPVAEVDGAPELLLKGDRPMWRPLGAGVKGEDVRQLETALVSLGFADASTFDVDDTWTAETTTAVKTMQKWLHMAVDGRFDMGEIVFNPSTVRIAKVGGVLGDPASAAGIEVTGLDQSVQASVKSSKLDVVKVGAAVTVELPDGSTVDGTIAEIDDAVVGSDGSITFPVVVSTGAIDVGDGTSVKVDVSVVLASGAITVPADALLALAEGGYAVEVPDKTTPTGTRLVGVEVGAFADGWVQVTGKVADGDQVVIP